MNYIRADQLFIGASSFDEIHGFTTAFPAVDLYLTCLKSCLESCVLVDSSNIKGGTAIARPIRSIIFLLIRLKQAGH